MQRRPRPDLFSPDCPSRELLAVIAGKWSLLVVAALADGSMRTGDLQRRVGGISAKVLSQTLKTLEAHGFIERRDYSEMPPRVDYRLTRHGESLRSALGVLDDWVIENFWTVAKSCTANDHAVGVRF